MSPPGKRNRLRFLQGPDRPGQEMFFAESRHLGSSDLSEPLPRHDSRNRKQNKAGIKAMINFQNYQPLVPMAYLILATLIAIGGHLAGLPEGITGLLVGAALTRVKMPAKS